MQITNLDVRKYKRFFAFGCSFTNYIWPTWADLVGNNIPIYENWGCGGAGNQYIFNSIIECNKRNTFNKDDLVIVMWTSCSREDRYVNDDWLLTPTIQREKVYGKSWAKKFANQGKGLMIRDFATIDATQHLLDAWNVDWVNLNGLPLIRANMKRVETDIKKKIATVEEFEQQWSDYQTNLSQGIINDSDYIEGVEVIQLYKDMFKNIKYPMLNHIIKNKSRPNYGDAHPLPSEALSYLNNTITHNLIASEFVKTWDYHVTNIQKVNVMPVTFDRTNPNRF